MNVEVRTCYECGRHGPALVERCEKCKLPESVVCEACVTETEGVVLDRMAAAHAKFCPGRPYRVPVSRRSAKKSSASTP